jgi:hypothetical protein
MQYHIKTAVQATVQNLFDLHGSVRTTDLVDAARPKESPAHAAFEWNDRKASEEYRLIQARRWIRVVTITRPDSTESERLIHVPRILSESDESKAGEYKPLSFIVEHPDEYALALGYAQAKMTAAKSSIEDLYKAAEGSGRKDQAAMIAQMARATEMWSEALIGLH